MSRVTRRAGRVVLLSAALLLIPTAAAVGQAWTERAADPETVPLSWQFYGEDEPARARSQEVATATAAAALGEIIRIRDDAAEDLRVAREIQADAEDLRPGEFVWRPERAQSGPAEIVVSLAAQRAYVFRDGTLIAISTVSTGRPGNETPTGRFPIIERKRRHFSNLYNNAPMPNMQRLTMDGIALHAGAIPGRAASHGCVRLPMAFSDLLFGITQRGNVVHILDGEPPEPVEALTFAGVPRSGAMRLAMLG